MCFFEISVLYVPREDELKSRGVKMEIQYESKQDISVELEKICCEWNVYAKRIDRARPKPLVNKMANSL